jgi:hypothetical protein
MNLETLKNQFQGRKFGELVLHHLKSQSHNDISVALQGTFHLLPDFFRMNEMEKLIDEFNAKIYEESFWQTDCADQFDNIIKIAKIKFFHVKLQPSEDDLFNVFNVIVLNFAYGASSQIEMKKFIRNSVTNNIFRRIFGRKDISLNFRWSIVFKKDGVPQYEMLGDNVIRMLGYYMIYYGKGGNPRMPWELVLRFNKNGKDIKLTNLFFPNSDTITRNLLEKIELIDPEYTVSFFKDEIFINRVTGDRIKINSLTERNENIFADIEALKNGTYEEYRKKKDAEVTFFKVLNEIFS